jgi:predicted transposase YdaD
MANFWDDMLKRMFAAHPQQFLNWLLPNAVILHELSLELKTQTLSELKAKQTPETRDLYTDILYVILWYGVQTIVHIEFQRRGDKDMGERLWQYNTTTTINKRMPVISFVIYLRNEGPIEEPPYIRRAGDGKPLHIFFYEAVKLWEVPAEQFFHEGLEGLLPFVMLTQDGKQHEVVDRMIKRIVTTNNLHLIPTAFNFGLLTYSKLVEQQWLNGRFEMYRDELEESLFYQGIMKEGLEKGLSQGLSQGLEEGRVKGREETLREILLNFLTARYPTLVDLAKEQLGQLRDVDTLQQVVNKTFYLQTASEIEEALLAIRDDSRNN